MLNKNLQMINDEIIGYKQSVHQIEEKINLLKFLNSVDPSVEKILNLNVDDLMEQKKLFEKNLKKLLNEKSKMIKPPETSVKVDNYLTMQNYISFMFD